MELNVVDKKIGGLGETIQTMDNKIGKFQDTLREALEKLEINSKETVPNSPTRSDESIIINSVSSNISKQRVDLSYYFLASNLYFSAPRYRLR